MQSLWRYRGQYGTGDSTIEGTLQGTYDTGDGTMEGTLQGT